MNILITGAFGFVGTNLSKSIKTAFKHRLIAVDVVEPAAHLYDEYYSWKDLTKINWPEIDAVIHLAGKAHDSKNTAEEKAYFDINLGLTRTIFNAFLKSDATKFIHFSSVKAVADSVLGESLIEEDIPNPQTHYGKSKLAAEQFILGELKKLSHTERTGADRSVSNRSENIIQIPRDEKRGFAGNSNRFLTSFGMTGQKKVYILRPCMIHGPGNKGNLNLLYGLVQKGIPWPLGAFENRRSFTSIDNLSFIIHQLLEKNITPGIYQVADDEPLSTNRVIELIAESNGKKARVWNLNPNLIKRVAGMGDFLRLPLNSERLKKLTESYVVSNTKLKKALGIKNMPVNAEEGMLRTLESFKKN